mmetsp:Transcript_22718/g.51641  ORF Transcript_22718/g.51641 Transcript_22718/m.51641 type:complete len:234 (-) Transcript_22718:469-1170(-)
MLHPICEGPHLRGEPHILVHNHRKVDRPRVPLKPHAPVDELLYGDLARHVEVQKTEDALRLGDLDADRAKVGLDDRIAEVRLELGECQGPRGVAVCALEDLRHLLQRAFRLAESLLDEVVLVILGVLDRSLDEYAGDDVQQRERGEEGVEGEAKHVERVYLQQAPADVPPIEAAGDGLIENVLRSQNVAKHVQQLLLVLCLKRARCRRVFFVDVVGDDLTEVYAEDVDRHSEE